MRRFAHLPLWLTALCFACTPTPNALACDAPVTVCRDPDHGSFALIEGNQPAAVIFDAEADPAVRRVVASFAADLERVSGQAPEILQDLEAAEGRAVVIGVVGQSPIIDELVEAGKLDVSGLAGQWEAFRLAVVDNPWPNVSHALIIVGSDRRGAVFGTYDLSEKIGVSPWHWFADVPVEPQSDVSITAGSRGDTPKVKYRGFFINDENPSFNDWAHKRFGGINSQMYEHVFELLLRLKGNYLWPAMWLPKAFHVDDPNNTVLTDEMGVVVGTTHHEPMNRAHAEWTRQIIDDFA
ncbi:MAG TPA: glycosyl hydrolase 115 family protein, partial [Rhodothermales bacterium]|nr:glycosyl hydrolase 115 family protein [Rhodothermales bacterium]